MVRDLFSHMTYAIHAYIIYQVHTDQEQPDSVTLLSLLSHISICLCQLMVTLVSN